MVAFYWLFLSGAVFLCGAFVCKIFVTGPAGADVCIIGEPGHRCLGENVARLVFFLSLFTFVANVFHIVFHAASMTETPLGEVPEIMEPFLLKTKYGRFSFFR